MFILVSVDFPTSLQTLDRTYHFVFSNSGTGMEKSTTHLSHGCFFFQRPQKIIGGAAVGKTEKRRGLP